MKGSRHRMFCGAEAVGDGLACDAKGIGIGDDDGRAFAELFAENARSCGGGLRADFQAAGIARGAQGFGERGGHGGTDHGVRRKFLPDRED